MTVEADRDGRVLVIRMQREAKRNALNEAITTGIDAAMNELEDEPDLWCGILTGGEHVFSAGADLAADRASRPTAAAWSGSSPGSEPSR